MKVETSTQNRKASAFFTSLVKRWAKKVSSQACISSTCWHLLIVHAWPGVPEAGSCDKERRLKQKHAVAGEEEEEETKREHLVLLRKVRKQTDKRKSRFVLVMCSVFATASAFLLNFFHSNNHDMGVLCVYYVYYKPCLEFSAPNSRHASILFVLKLGLLPIGIRSKGDTQLRSVATLIAAT